MFAAYANLKKVFDSVNPETLWDPLRLHGIPLRIVGLLSSLYSGTLSALKCGGEASSFFPMNTEVKHGCMLVSSLFNTCMDWVVAMVVNQNHCEASVSKTENIFFFR